MTKNYPEVVSAVTLADYLVVSPRQIYVLAERGLVVKSGPSCRRYTGHLRRIVEIGVAFPRLSSTDVEKLGNYVTAEILKHQP